LAIEQTSPFSFFEKLVYNNEISLYARNFLSEFDYLEPRIFDLSIDKEKKKVSYRIDDLDNGVLEVSKTFADHFEEMLKREAINTVLKIDQALMNIPAEQAPGYLSVLSFRISQLIEAADGQGEDGERILLRDKLNYLNEVISGRNIKIGVVENRQGARENIKSPVKGFVWLSEKDRLIPLLWEKLSDENFLAKDSKVSFESIFSIEIPRDFVKVKWLDKTRNGKDGNKSSLVFLFKLLMDRGFIEGDPTFSSSFFELPSVFSDMKGLDFRNFEKSISDTIGKGSKESQPPSKKRLKNIVGKLDTSSVSDIKSK
jgi:hypothetical protein